MFKNLKNKISKISKNKDLKKIVKKGVKFSKTDEGKYLLDKGLNIATGGTSELLKDDKLKELIKNKSKSFLNKFK